MAIDKIDRAELKEILINTLSNSVTFKFIEGVNPCKIQFDGVEYNIYIKNLSPAQLSNKNPEIWRIQLPIRNVFNELKIDPVPFILLGYDSENDIYATWNPYWAKQRLNNAKSVSFYSRKSLQDKANETQAFQRQTLNNEGEVVTFPRTKLLYFLVNIEQFFPEMTEYVALGSRKRTEANEAYKTLCDHTNISLFAHYLAKQSLAEKTINNYCRAINKLIKDGYFSRNRKIFLACDSLVQYPDVVSTFIQVPEVKEQNKIWHNQFSAALRAYIKFLLETTNQNTEEDSEDENISYSKETQDILSNQTIDNLKDNTIVKDFADYLSALGLTERSVLTYVRAIEKLIREGYLGKPNSLKSESIQESLSELLAIPEIAEMNKNWKGVFSAALNHYGQYVLGLVAEYKKNSAIQKSLEEQLSKQIEKEKKNNIVQEEIDFDNVDWETPFIDENGKLTQIANPVLIDQLRPYLDTEYKAIATAFSIIEDFYENRFDTMEIKDWSKLFDLIDWENPYYTPESNNGKRKRYILRVTYPDGRIVEERVVYKTLVDVVETAGVERVQELGIKLNNCDLVSDTVTPLYEIGQKSVGKNGLYLMTSCDTVTKYKIIEQISDELDLDLSVDFIPINNDGTTAQAIPKPYSIVGQKRQKIKVTFPDGRVVQENKVFKTLIEVVLYVGIEKVRSLGIIVNGDNLITNTINPLYQNALKPLGENLYISTAQDTQRKYAIIKQISDIFNLNLQIELI